MTLLALGLSTAVALAAGSWYFYTQQGLLFDLTFPLIAIFAIYPDARLHQLFPRAGRPPPHPLRLQPVSVAGAGRAARQSPKKLDARRRGAQHDHHVQRRARLHHHLRNLQGRSAGPDQLMNRLLTPLTNAIIERKGTIDKYIGDAIMAFWNAPLDDPDHEVNACAAALDMLRRIDDAQPRARGRGAGGRQAVLPDQDRARHQYRHLRGRQHGLGPALRLFGAGRLGEPRLAARRPVQVLRHADHRRRQHRREASTTGSRRSRST